jgi:PAS domain S-box-containing protein
MNRKQRQLDSWLLRGLLLCLVGVLFIHWTAGNGESQETRHILVLYSLQNILPVQEEVDQGLRTALQTNNRHPVEINIEFLDLDRFPESAYLDELLSLLRRKYAHRRPDVVIPVFHPAVNFLQKYGEVIFPDVPMVFTAELKQFLPNLTMKPNMTGVYAEPAITGNLKLALALKPRTRQVVVVGGTSRLDRIHLSWVREAFAPFANQVEFTYLTDLPIEEIQERVAHLPPHTIIFFATLARDGKGREFPSRDAVNLLAKAANAPIFGFWDTLLGEGIVGGSLISFQEQGRLAGELAVRILNGEKAENLPLVLARNPLLFDGRQLQRWGISEDRLPRGSLVRYREQSLWELYGGWIIGFLGLLGLQSVFIGALLVNRAKRRRAEQGLEERLRFEEVLSDLSAAFINFSGDQANQKIDTCLNEVLKSLKIDRISVMEFSEDGKQFKTRHFSTASGIPGISLYIPTEKLPWFSQNLARGETLMYSHLPEDLPAEASHEKEFCRQEGLKSIISLPLQVAGSVLGVINFSTMRENVDWSRYPVPRLGLVAEIFANALGRQRASESLQEHEQSYRIVADFTYDWEYWENPDGSLRYVSPACERISGRPAEEFLAHPQLFREIIVPEDRKIWDDHQKEIRQASAPHELQFRLLRPDGGIRWIEHACQPVYGSRGQFLGFRASNRDITPRKNTELQEQQHREELAHVMRVATLGELTASLAHEFNQPLNAVLNNAQAALRFLNREQPDFAEVDAALQDIARDGKRASAVIQRLRSFLKPGVMHPEAVDINDVMQEAVSLVQNELLSRRIAMHLDLAPDLPPVRGDRIQLQQVVLNLLLNAMEALKQSATAAPEIHLRTEQGSQDYITVSLKDNGTGLSADELEKIFEPFWTSKAEGLGLGLSISRSIISAHGGRLWATPNSDTGVTFLFTLPHYQGESDEPLTGHGLRSG